MPRSSKAKPSSTGMVKSAKGQARATAASSKPKKVTRPKAKVDLAARAKRVKRMGKTYKYGGI